MRVGVIGINHKLATLELREHLAMACQRRFALGSSVQDHQTFVLLSTCNRTEVYFSSNDLPATHSYLLQILRDEIADDFDQKVYSYFGVDCFLHLSRVTSGLDSAIVAETEIQGQVKTAYENATSHITLPHEIHYLFQKALKIGKKVRSTLTIERGMPDLEHAVLQTGMNALYKPSDAKILFVGASEVNCKILKFLKSKNFQDITLCNRSTNRARSVAEMHQIPVLEWSSIGNWVKYNWIIFGTKASHYLIGTKDLSNDFVSRKLIFDLSVPRNVEPQIGQDPRVTLINIDQINRSLKVRRQRMTHLLEQAEQLVTDSVHLHVTSFQTRERSVKFLS